MDDRPSQTACRGDTCLLMRRRRQLNSRALLRAREVHRREIYDYAAIALVALRLARWTPASMHRTEPPAISMTGPSSGSNCAERSISLRWREYSSITARQFESIASEAGDLRVLQRDDGAAGFRKTTMYIVAASWVEDQVATYQRELGGDAHHHVELPTGCIGTPENLKGTDRMADRQRFQVPDHWPGGGQRGT